MERDRHSKMETKTERDEKAVWRSEVNMVAR